MPVTAQAVLGGAQAVQGLVQQFSGNARLKRLMQQREAYKTPDEVQQQLQIAENQAQSGYGADTMAYINNQTNNALTNSLDTVTKLGGDPNDISAIFSRNVDAIMKTAGDSEMAKVLKFDKLYTGLQGVIQGKDAEFADRRAKLDDQMASAGMKVKAGSQNLQSGLGNVVGAFANDAIANKGLPDSITPVTGAVNTMPAAAQSSSTQPAIGTTATPAPLAAPLAGSVSPADYANQINWWNTFNRK